MRSDSFVVFSDEIAAAFLFEEAVGRHTTPQGGREPEGGLFVPWLVLVEAVEERPVALL